MEIKAYRAQAATEYLATYGWAILIIAVVVVLLYIFVLGPSSSTPTTCTFNSGAYCRDAIFSSNTAGSYVVIIISNGQQYPIANPVFKINVQNSGNITGSCTPGFVLASAAVVCNAIMANRYGQGSLVYSQVYLKETVCVTGSTIASCSGGNAQTLSGVLDAHVEQPMPSLP